MRTLLSAIAAVVLSAAPAFAVTTFDFESFSDNAPIGSMTVGGVTATVSAFRNSNGAVYTPIGFDTNRNLPASGDDRERDADLLGPHGDSSQNAPNFGIIAVIREENGTDGADTVNGPANDRRVGLPATMRFDFDRDVAFQSLDAFDFGDTSGEANLQIYLDGTRVLAAGSNVDGISGDGLMEAFLADRVYTGRQLDLVFRSSGGIDNIRVGVVPVPAGALLLISGFGLVAGVRRMRSRGA